MSDKILFPGVSEKDVQKQHKAEQKRAAALAAAQQKEQEREAAVKAQKEEKKRRSDAYEKHIGSSGPKASKNFTDYIGPILFLAFGIFMSGLFVTGMSKNDDDLIVGVEITGGGLLIAISTAIAYAAHMKKQGRPFSVVDMMLDLEKYGKEYNLNTRKIERLIAVSDDIIQKICADNPFYFDMLIKGDFAIKNPEAYKKMASEVILGHLKSHPSDAQRVLDIFNEKSIPENVLQKIKKLQKSNNR